MIVLAGLVFIAMGCDKKSGVAITGANPGVVVATVNDVNITSGELDGLAKSRLQKIEHDIYEVKRGVLNDLIEKKLLEEAAKKQGKSVEAYLKENIDDKVAVPTDDEIKSFYESRKDQMGGKSFKDAEPMIKSYLVQSRKMAAEQQLYSGLMTAANVKIKLEPPRVDIEAGDNPSMGPKGAPILIVEFTDYQCPFCGRVRSTISQLMDEYKDKIRYVLRDFPLSFHQFAKKAHEAAHCAGDQGKYWEYNKELWAHQQALDVGKLKEYANVLKLDAKKFGSCLDEGKYTKKVEENVEYGASVGAQGTPSFFINGIFINGARPVGDFKTVIDAELNK